MRVTNANEGAESTLAYLLALAEMRLAAQTSLLSGGPDTSKVTAARTQEGKHVGPSV